MLSTNVLAYEGIVFEPDKENLDMASILVVDDSEELRGLYSCLLLADGYEVMLARDGVDAVSKLLRCEYDVVLLDYAMPGMTGLEVLHQILCLNLASPPQVIMVSAYGDPQMAQQALELGASAYLLKGEVSTEELLEMVREAVITRRQKTTPETGTTDFIQRRA